MTYFKEKLCFVGNGLFISWTASCKFTHLWEPHFLPIVWALLRSAVVLSARMLNSHSSANLMSCHLWKELRLAGCVCILRECVANELEEEAGMEEASNFQWSFISWQNCSGSSSCFSWILVSFFRGAWPSLLSLWDAREEMGSKIK